MNLARLSIGLSVAIGLGASVSLWSAEPKVLRWIPESCNTVAVVNVRKLVDSPLGKKEKWSDEHRRAYAAGLLSAPPWVEQVVRAMMVGPPTEGGGTIYSIYSMRRDSAIGDIAKHERAPSERIGGSFAVLSPRGVYFVQLAPGLVGAVQPADRQAVSRWVRAGKEGDGPQLSPYLRGAIDEIGNAQFVLAVDLTDMLNPTQVRGWIATSPDLRSVKNLDEMTSLLSSLRGARLSMHVADAITARLQLDFGLPVGGNANVLQAVVRTWLDDAGARVTAIARAKATASGNAMVLESVVDERALRRLMSLLQSPHPSVAAAESRNVENEKPNALASVGYYDAVLALLEALDRRSQDSEDYRKTALWHEKFAGKIDGLPAVGVDPELLRWGQEISGNLRALASSLRGVPVEVDKLQRSIQFNANASYRWYGSTPTGPLYFPVWVRPESNLQDVRAQQENVIAQNAGQREAIWTMLRDATVQIARKMEYKYHVKFKQPPPPSS